MNSKNETRGLWLGLLGVAIFAVTLPMTRLATGTADAPQLSPWFVTLGRAALAGGLSIVFLLATRSRWPTPEEWRPLSIATLGNALGFPVLIGYALRTISASHAAVIIALLPLATAVVAALVMHQRARLGFWLSACIGAALVMGFSLWRAMQHGPGLGLEWGDVLMLGAVVSAALGYVYGAKVTPTLGAEQVICWVCVLALPVTLPGALLTWPEQTIRASSWWALGYVGVFSMWAGFFAWYRGLALGGTLKVSQVQLLQPFLSILAAIPLLGESLDLVTVGFCFAVVATVFIGKRFASSPVPPPLRATPHPPAGGCAMNTETLVAAGVFAVVSAVTPGPNNTMLMASGVNFGFRRSQRHLWGVNLGFTFILLCVGLGLHSVLDRFPQFYDVLRYVGSAYMLWIAWKLASARPAAPAHGTQGTEPAAIHQPMGFWAAAAFQWVNPKAWVMGITCMSTYLAADAPVSQVALLAGVFMVLGAPCSAFWLGFGQAMRGLLQDPLRLRIFNITMALALVASLYPMLTG